MITPKELNKDRQGIFLAEMGMLEKHIIEVNKSGGQAATWSCTKRINSTDAAKMQEELSALGYKVRLTSGYDRDGYLNTLYVTWAD